MISEICVRSQVGQIAYASSATAPPIAVFRPRAHMTLFGATAGERHQEHHQRRDSGRRDAVIRRPETPHHKYQQTDKQDFQPHPGRQHVKQGRRQQQSGECPCQTERPAA